MIGLFGVLGSVEPVDEGTMDGDRNVGLSISMNGSSGEGQKVECSADVGLVDVVILETLVGTVSNDSVSEELFR